MKTKAIYSGAFDLFTLGHQFIVDKALSIFDEVYVAIGTNAQKKSSFSMSDKIKMIKNAFHNNPRVKVLSFENQFLANFCKDNGIKIHRNYALYKADK